MNNYAITLAGCLRWLCLLAGSLCYISWLTGAVWNGWLAMISILDGWLFFPVVSGEWLAILGDDYAGWFAVLPGSLCGCLCWLAVLSDRLCCLNVYAGWLPVVSRMLIMLARLAYIISLLVTYSILLVVLTGWLCWLNSYAVWLVMLAG
jgi:hypothetical protein